MVIIGYKSQFLEWYCQVIFGLQPKTYQFVHMGVAASKSALVSTPCHLKIPLFWVVFPFSPIAYLLIIRNWYSRNHQNALPAKNPYQSTNKTFEQFLKTLSIDKTWVQWGRQTRRWWTQSSSRARCATQEQPTCQDLLMILQRRSRAKKSG